MSTNEFRRILIATDGSEPANAALELAASLARTATDPEVRVVHVWNLEIHHRHGAWDGALHVQAEQVMNEALMRLRELGVQAERELVRADGTHVSVAIGEMARQFGADLVVVGSRGLSDWESLVGHGVSHGVLASVDCPVLIVRGNRGTASRQSKRVLLAVEGGEDIEAGVKAASAAARGAGSRVLVVHVLRAATSEHGVSFAEPKEHGNAVVATAAGKLDEAGIEADTWLLRPGPVPAIVADAADRWDADIVVIGSARMGDLGCLLFESVTHDLLRATDRPVLVAETQLRGQVKIGVVSDRHVVARPELIAAEVLRALRTLDPVRVSRRPLS